MEIEKLLGRLPAERGLERQVAGDVVDAKIRNALDTMQDALEDSFYDSDALSAVKLIPRPPMNAPDLTQ